jgi:restriction system protein
LCLLGLTALGCVLHNPLSLATACTLLAMMLWIGIIVMAHRDEANRHRALQIANIDAMTGVDFELYLERLLLAHGYVVQLTKGSGDLGVDLIATRGAEMVAIQAKRCSSKISRRAVSDAVAGMLHYRCNKAMVVTNSYFTSGAAALAQSTNCVLVDRSVLTLWILSYQNARK